MENNLEVGSKPLLRIRSGPESFMKRYSLLQLLFMS